MRPTYYFVIAATLLAVTGCHKPKPVVPTSFTPFTAVDKNFTCDQPAGWADQTWGSGATDSGVEFTSAEADIHIDADEAGSFIGDIVSSNNPIGDGTMGSSAPSPVPPVEKLHAAQQQNYMHKYHQYVELGTYNTSSPYGDGRVTEYTADGIHGYRATILGRERAVDIDTQCSEADWPLLKPAFWQVINSIKPGSGS